MIARQMRLAAIKAARILTSCVLLGHVSASFIASCRADEVLYRLEAVSFGELPGFSADKHDEALRVFLKSCATTPHSSATVPTLRMSALKRACAAGMSGESAKNPRAFFERQFQPFRIVAEKTPDAFFTGYYQPEIPGSLFQSADFPTPVYAPPPDLTALPTKDRTGALAELTAARRRSDGSLSPYPDRGAIEDGALEKVPGVRTLVYLKDKADLFLAQVQGSARVRLTDGRILHLAFAGRNGQPYTALARVLVQRGVAPPAEMTMRRLIDWLRQNGLGSGQAGDELLRLNRSYVFFSASMDKDAARQPLGGGGVALSPLRSIAIDAHIWPYGLPFYVDARLPWRGGELEPFQRLTIAQDTGSAIVGPARADIFYGLGDAAGARAGETRHHGQFFLLLPKE
jgi:membrane-bound lytic murein transglycosylase A